MEGTPECLIDIDEEKSFEEYAGYSVNVVVSLKSWYKQLLPENLKLTRTLL